MYPIVPSCSSDLLAGLQIHTSSASSLGGTYPHTEAAAAIKSATVSSGAPPAAPPSLLMQASSVGGGRHAPAKSADEILKLFDQPRSSRYVWGVT